MRVPKVVGAAGIGVAALLGGDVAYTTTRCIQTFWPDPYYLILGLPGFTILIGAPVFLGTLAVFYLAPLFKGRAIAVRLIVLAGVVAFSLVAAYFVLTRPGFKTSCDI